MPLEGIICPECRAPLKEKDLIKSLVCTSCKTNLKKPKYLDFIEYLVANGIVTDIDFFDEKLYSEEIERIDPSDQEEVDPRDYEKKKETPWLLGEELETANEGEKGESEESINEWEGLEEDWEEFNQRNLDDSSN